MSTTPLPLRFQIGTHTLMAIQRDLVHVPLSLEDVMAGRLPVLPPLDRTAQGYAIRSLPADRRDAMAYAGGSMIACVRQHYNRYFADLKDGFDHYFAGLPAATQLRLRRLAKQAAEVSGGVLDVRRFRTPDEMLGFHDVARRISIRGYQDRLFTGGLPDDDAFVASMQSLAAADRVRAWLLYIAGEPAAYLYCPLNGDTLRHEHAGIDPAFADFSPGGVLHLEAMRDLFQERRFIRYDFIEGECSHKRQLATGGIPCIDMLLLRASLANRLTTVALGGFDRAAVIARQANDALGLNRLAEKLRRT
jgi:hypothetical protein